MVEQFLHIFRCGVYDNSLKNKGLLADSAGINLALYSGLPFDDRSAKSPGRTFC